jgi:hypothetical protein
MTVSQGLHDQATQILNRLFLNVVEKKTLSSWYLQECAKMQPAQKERQDFGGMPC